MSNVKEIPIDSVVYREDCYPRIDKDPALVQRYAEQLEMMPDIEVNQHNELIDGWHRWTARKKKKCETVRVIVTQTSSDVELLALACRRNASAGKQLDERDKSRMAIRLYNGGTGLEKSEIAEILSVTERSINSYLKDIDEQLRADREEKMLNLWLACWTQEDIAEEVGVGQATVAEFLQEISKMETLPKSIKSAISHEDDFSPQVYSIWNFGKSTNEVKHPGNVPPEILDNLLYYYTKPFDVVFDPFAGGGMTIAIGGGASRALQPLATTPLKRWDRSSNRGRHMPDVAATSGIVSPARQSV